jgi:Cu/Ag efflux protein CusF
MRHPLLILVAVFAAGLILAQVNSVAAAGKTHDLTATVVAVDIQAKKITFQDEAGTTNTSPVLDKAVESLKSIKAGEKVVLTCRDNENGNHEAVIAIRPAAPEKS